MLKRAILIAVFLTHTACGQQQMEGSSATAASSTSSAPSHDSPLPQRTMPFSISTHEGVEMIRTGPVELTYLDLTSAIDSLHIEKVEVNGGKCMVMAQNFFFTPLTLGSSDKTRLRIVQPDNFGNLGLCDIRTIVIGTDQGWYSLTNEGSHYEATEIDVPLANRELPVPPDAVFVTDSAGKKHCIEWDCLVSPSVGKIDSTSVDFLKNGWVSGPPKFYERSDNFSHNSASLAIFQEDGEATCVVVVQEKDEKTWDVTTRRIVHQGRYKVQPGGVEISGKELINGCFQRLGTTDSVITVTVSLSPEERQIYPSPDGQSQYYSGKTNNWCRSRLRLTNHSARGATLCEISGFSDGPLMKLMQAVTSTSNPVQEKLDRDQQLCDMTGGRNCPGESTLETAAVAMQSEASSVDVSAAAAADTDGYVDQQSFNMNPPEYPAEASRAGIEGVVVVLVEVSAEGDVVSVKIDKSSRNRMLDNAALEAAYRWKFYPSTRAGQPINSAVRVPVTFSLGG